MQAEKTELLIEVTLLGMVMEVNFLQVEKALTANKFQIAG